MANNNDWLDAMIRDYAIFTQMAIGCLFFVFILALAGSVLVLLITSYLQRGHKKNVRKQFKRRTCWQILCTVAHVLFIDAAAAQSTAEQP